MFGWSASEIPLLLALPLLLIGSGFFSGSETALFGLSATERMALHKKGSIAARAVDSLLVEPRMLLITVLGGNMVVNVLYFVISSVLLIAASEASVVEQVLVAILTLMVLVIFGEVLPKLVANSNRTTVAPLVAPVMLGLHRLITPLRRVVDALIVTPLNRLTAPSQPPPPLSAYELDALLELSSVEGVIDPGERSVLRDVIELGSRKVHNVMTPRVRMQALPYTATRNDVILLAKRTRLTKLPIYRGDIDHIAGILHVKRFLLDERARTVATSSALTRARFIPEIATLDRLLEDFRRTRTQVAIAVDEYGGTAGIIAIEDIVLEILGELRDAASRGGGPIRPIGDGAWRVAADTNLRALEAIIPREQLAMSGEATSVNGLITGELGRSPVEGDVVRIGAVVFEVVRALDSRADVVIVRLEPEASG